MEIPFEIVVKLLDAKTHSLRDLAELSGLDPFTFYRGANLIGVNLEEQDLTGLNFDRCDLRFANVTSIKFDAGAFNRSQLDPKQSWLQDDFVFDIADIFDHPSDDILLFARFRKGFVDDIINLIHMNYNAFSTYSSLGINSLRKARQGSAIAAETAAKIYRAFERALADPNVMSDASVGQIIKQPAFQFLSGGNNGAFKAVSRERYLDLILMREAAVDYGRLNDPDGDGSRWRDTPEALEWWNANVLPPEWQVKK